MGQRGEHRLWHTQGRVSVALMVFLLVALVIVLPAWQGERYIMDLWSQMAVYALFALSLNILVGYLGNLSFGHAAYFALGGYACAWLLSTAQWPWWLAMPAAVLFSGVGALLIGWFCVRLQDIYFAILTLAFSMLIWAILFKWTAVTGGDEGFIGVVLPTFLEDPLWRYTFIIGVSSVATIGLALVLSSPFGIALQAIRDNPLRVAYLGYPVKGLRLSAFVLAGSLAGLAGVLLCVHQRAMFTESAFWTQSGHVLIMVLLGGIRFYIGPIVGAIVLIALEVTLGQWAGYWQLMVGGILFFIVIFTPQGIVGIVVHWLHYWRERFEREPHRQEDSHS